MKRPWVTPKLEKISADDAFKRLDAAAQRVPMTITPDQIPPEVLEAAARAAHDQWRHECAVTANKPVSNWHEWHELKLAEQLGWIEQAGAAIAAALAAWPGSYEDDETMYGKEIGKTIFLPLAQEPTNE